MVKQNRVAFYKRQLQSWFIAGFNKQHPKAAFLKNAAPKRSPKARFVAEN